MTVATAARGASGPYTGTGAGSAVYVYGFQIYAPNHIEVDVLAPNGTFVTLQLSQDGSSLDYTVQGVGVGTGGTITLLANGQSWMNGSSLASGYKLFIFRTVPYTQLANLRGEGGYNPSTNEQELDLLCEADQQLNDMVARTLRLPMSDPIPPPLPPAALRANGFQAYDGSGNPIISQGITTVPAGTLASIVDSVSALKALAAPASAVTYYVRGYYTPGDGGDGFFRWNAADSSTDNGGTILQPNAGGVGRWNRIYNNWVDARWFGAKGDGVTNDQAAILAAVTACPEVRFSGGTYVVSSVVNMPSRLTKLIGVGSAVLTTSSSNAIIQAADGMVYFEARNLTFSGNGIGIKLNCNPANVQFDEFHISACRFLESSTSVYGIYLNGAPEGRIEHCLFSGCGGIYRTLTVNTDIVACRWTNCGYGVFDDGQLNNYSAGLAIIGGTMVGNTYGYYASLMDDARIIGVMIDYCDNPIVMIGAAHVKIRSCFLSSRTTAPTILLDRDIASNTHCQNIKIIGNEILCRDTTGSAPNGNATCIYIKYTDSALIYQNDITFYTLYGVNVENCTFVRTRHNTISPRSTWGVYSYVATVNDSSSNALDFNALTQAPNISSASGTRVRKNTGYYTEGQGNGQITAGNTSVVVAHGLSVTPPVAGIQVTPSTSWGNTTQWWVTSIGASNFTVQVNVAPGANFGFSWMATYQV